LSSTVKEICDNAFLRCVNLREVLLNEGLLKIGDDAFAGCVALVRIQVPSTVTAIGTGAFSECTSLKEVELNEGLQEIGDEVFEDCAQLVCIKVPSISKRINGLSRTSLDQVKSKVRSFQDLEWRIGELFVSPEAIRVSNWESTRFNLNKVLKWVSGYELKESMSIVDLALWKAQIEESAAASTEEREDARQIVIPNSVKSFIVQYLQQTQRDDDSAIVEELA